MKLYRVWVLRFVKVLVSFEIVVALLNYTFDPLWCFGNVNKLNSKAIIIDQRLQKTNLRAFGPSGYDTLILGSSRTEPNNGLEFLGRKAFNYAVPAIYPDEYPGYIDFFKKHNQGTFIRSIRGLISSAAAVESLLKISCRITIIVKALTTGLPVYIALES